MTKPTSTSGVCLWLPSCCLAAIVGMTGCPDHAGHGDGGTTEGGDAATTAGVTGTTGDGDGDPTGGATTGDATSNTTDGGTTSTTGGTTSTTGGTTGGEGGTTSGTESGGEGGTTGGSVTCPDRRCDPVTLAMNQHRPFAVTVDATHVYWSNFGEDNVADGEVKRMPIAGGAQTVLATGQANPNVLRVHDGTLYFANYGASDTTPLDGSVVSVPIAGGPTTALVTAPQVSEVEIDGGHIYYVSRGIPPTDYGGSVGRISITEGTVEILVEDMRSVMQLAIDDTHVYFTTQESFIAGATLHRQAKDGGDVEVLVEGLDNPQGLAVDTDNIYYLLGSSGSLYSVDRAGGTPTALASTGGYLLEVAVDETHAYFSDAGANFVGGSIARVPLGGGDVEILADDQSVPFGIALDDTHLYWANAADIFSSPLAEGEILYLPK